MVSFQRMKDDLDDLGTSVASKVPPIGRAGCIAILAAIFVVVLVVGFGIGFSAAGGKGGGKRGGGGRAGGRPNIGQWNTEFSKLSNMYLRGFHNSLDTFM